MIGGTCQHFHFGGSTASLKNWHMTFHDCKHMSTLPFWGRYRKLEKLTNDVPWLQALVNTSILGALQQAWQFDIWCKLEKLTYDVPWLQALVNTSVLGALQQAWKIDIWRSMIASTCQHFRFGGATASLKNWHICSLIAGACQHFHFGGATASLKNWHMTFHDCGQLSTNHFGGAITFHACRHLSTLPFWGRYSKPEKSEKIDIWRSMIAGACQRFHFGGATASLKNWHMKFHDCRHLSTVPFWGRYSKPENWTYDVIKPEKLTYDVPWLQALVNTSVLGALQQAWKIDIWCSLIAGACRHFHFGGATASLKNWHMTFHDCGQLSTLPFWGRYNVPCLQALVNTSILGALQQAWKIDMKFHDCRHLSTLPCFFSKAFVHPGSSRICTGWPTSAMPKPWFACAPSLGRSVWWWLVVFLWCVECGDVKNTLKDPLHV